MILTSDILKWPLGFGALLMLASCSFGLQKAEIRQNKNVAYSYVKHSPIQAGIFERK